MKTRFTTLDICAVVTELQENAIGLRLANIYDIDNKTYLLKLIKTDTKKLLLIESGIRMHLSEFDWPKNTFPSGFAMKLRKHLRGRRLISVTQLGIDRIIDLQFGSNEAAYHMIIELYDRGNIALTDCDYVILNLLRYRRPTATTKDDKKDEDSDVRIAVHEEYPIKSARPHEPLINLERLVAILKEGRIDTPVKRMLNSHLPYGISTIEHCLCTAGFPGNARMGVEFDIVRDSEKLLTSLQNGENLLRKAMSVCSKGYIIQKSEKKLIDGSEMLTNIEFQPHLFHQHQQLPHIECDSFNKAVDEFFGALESQRNDMKVLQRERVAMKKLENVRKDQQSRISGLRVEQDNDYLKATLIEANLTDVDKAIRVICGAIANQLDWSDIEALVRDAQSHGDPVASQIRSLKLQTNSFMMALSMPDYEYDSDLSSEDENDDEKPPAKKEEKKSKPLKIEIDLSLSAYGNAARYYSMKRQAASKEQRTVESSEKAFKSAEKKVTQTLKEAATVHNIQKARKVYWFERFIWFISTENYLIIGGHDAQQNEILVKKYLRAGDVYVHADLHGATSCIIKNNDPSMPIPPKTLNEAGTMAICHSAAWDAKVVTSAWWVKHDQVSKTAPSGEYLTTGSFLIRGKKNYLPPSYLVYGFGFLFKVDETCVWKHKEERKVRNAEDDDDDAAAGAHKVEMMIEVTNNNDKDVGSGGHVIDDEVIKEEEENDDDDDTGKAADCDGDKDEDEADDDDCNCSGEDDDEDVRDDDDDMKTSSTVVDFTFPDTQLKVDYHAPQFTPEEEKQTAHQHHEGKVRLSAKDRRDLRKQKKLGNNPQPAQQQQQQQQQQTTEAREIEQKNVNKKTSDNNKSENKVQQKNKEPPPPQAPQPKRGQKNKLKKIKQKYKDQDEEDRQLVMEFLQSAKGPKVKEKKGKQQHHKNHPGAAGKKNNSNSQQQQQQQQQQGTKASDNKQDITPQEEKKEERHGEGVDSKMMVVAVAGKNKLKSAVTADVNDGNNSDEEREMTLKNEHLDNEPVTNTLESLTGCPCADDILLFAIPVCAPYNAMQNYKFKVKLTPGSNKKGKATKTALSMFQSTRETTPQEKDHLRSVKDYDLSKNVPGKVKLSAPNLQGMKQKNKKKR